MNFTPFARALMRRRGERVDRWIDNATDVQLRQLRWLLFRGASTQFGADHSFEDIMRNPDPRKAFQQMVEARGYEDFRAYVMRMINGEKDILWPGRCRNFAQSSGTSGGASKFIPVTPDSLRINHYAGASDVVAQYLRNFPESRMFAGKGFILGGSFDNKLDLQDKRVKVGDLSATLIDRIPDAANFFRVPDKKTALLSDWNIKLDRLANAAIKENITNLSGVPSWFMRVLLRALEITGAERVTDIWKNLEVFFHGGISFEPYRKQYDMLCDPAQMHYFETYNASEGFFATQSSRDNDGLLLLLDIGIYYEFIPLGSTPEDAVGIEGLEKGKIYELLISSCNGLWRYRIGDTVEIASVSPLKIHIAGRTKSFINAFGEELMEENALRAIADACAATGASIEDFTAGPLYAAGKAKGRHQWAIEWEKKPDDTARFIEVLDTRLRELNSDYDAKRKGNLFLDAPEIINLEPGSFDRWLARVGSGKLGGQRKIPRLRNDRSILDAL